MRLWIESAQSLVKTGQGVIRTFQTEELFCAVVASCPSSAISDQLVEQAIRLLEQGAPLDTVVETLLCMLPEGEHAPFSILRVREGARGELVECDAPPLFMTRGGNLVLLPVVEEESHGRLVRTCEFSLQDGDHIAMVSEGYIRAKGWSRQWGWRDIAISIRRLTETRCDAEQLLGALIRLYWRLAQEDRGALSEERRARSEERGAKSEDGSAFSPLTSDFRLPTSRPSGVQPPTSGFRPPASERDVSVLAMFVRPMRTATLWSGPPAPVSKSEIRNPKSEMEMLEKLMDEPGARIICGDTTAEIAARLLGAELVMEPRPEEGWEEVPPTSRLQAPAYAQGVDLVTEGVVTMGKARERMAGAQRARDLPRQEDGATRLARVLMTADKIHFLVGLAVNPAQTTDTGVPLRRIVVEDLMNDLRARGKIVSVEYF